jgi:2-polyprenyl-3-methyl-5-hydroxy-6-metoxy-1,4-benzoquinol methylase
MSKMERIQEEERKRSVVPMCSDVITHVTSERLLTYCQQNVKNLNDVSLSRQNSVVRLFCWNISL